MYTESSKLIYLQLKWLARQKRLNGQPPPPNAAHNRIAGLKNKMLQKEYIFI
jgi:hypothetical protein